MLKRSGKQSILGIEFEEQRIRVVYASLHGSEVRIQKRISAPLTLNPLSDIPELVGQEIRNHLNAAGITEKRCLVCVPLSWVLSQSVTVPNLTVEDTRSYIQVQAERSLPFSPDDLSIAYSLTPAKQGGGSALIAAVLTSRIHTLNAIFKAARLQPASITLGLPIPPQPQNREPSAVLWLRGDQVQFYVTASGSVVTLRNLEQSASPHDLEDLSASILRDIRITLGLLPSEIRDSLATLSVKGPHDAVDFLSEILSEPLQRWNLRLDTSAPPLHSEDPDYAAVDQAVSSYLHKGASILEFLPPKVSRVEQIFHRVSSRGNLWLGGTSTAVVVLISALFFYQHWVLSGLETQWKSMKDPVTLVESLQNKVKAYRPWFDSSVNSLSIAGTLTEAFPQEGSVWVKSVEIQSLSQVTCAGFASNNDEWLAMYNRLRQSQQVKDLQVQQVQGKAPLQFAFKFRWIEALSNG